MQWTLSHSFDFIREACNEQLYIVAFKVVIYIIFSLQIELEHRGRATTVRSPVQTEETNL